MTKRQYQSQPPPLWLAIASWLLFQTITIWNVDAFQVLPNSIRGRIRFNYGTSWSPCKRKYKCNSATSNRNNGDGSSACALSAFSSFENVERIYAISDLHTDNITNLEWLKQLCSMHKQNKSISTNDAIVIAGDISHEFSRLEETFSIIQENLNCHLFFVWGNHEAWIGGQEMDSMGIESSMQKIDMVKTLCHEMGVYTEWKFVGSENEFPVCILPIESWYDASLSLQGCEDLCTKFEKWRWVDFMRCVWPDQETLSSICSTATKKQSEYSAFLSNLQLQNTGKIPMGLTDILAMKNEKAIGQVQRLYKEYKLEKECNTSQQRSASQQNQNHDQQEQNQQQLLPGLITFSHFLPNQQTLPDWKDPTSRTFLRKEWLDHPVPETSAKFAKVAGSSLIDKQIRNIIPSSTMSNSSSSNSNSSNSNDSIQHLHVFGHSHRPKDFVFDNIRYIHNPLGKPAEREMNMVPTEVGFQLIWDCTNQSSLKQKQELKQKQMNKAHDNNDKLDNSTISSVGNTHNSGEIPGRQIIRYWEEQGGGKKVLARKMKHRKQRKRLEIKRFLRDLELKSKVSESKDTTT